MEVRMIEASDTIPMRHEILRPNQTREDCQYPKDQEETTFHLGIFANGTIISIASFYEEQSEKLEEIKQYRLRGMATLPKWRGKGAGSSLVAEAESIIQKRNVHVLWCNARTSARGYYDSLGFHQAGDVFDYPPIGPHVVLYKRIYP